MIDTTLIEPCGRRMPPTSPPFSNASGSKPGDGLRRGTMALLLAALLLTAACAHRTETIQNSRMPVLLPNGNWEVTDGWLQEQGELIRGWRAQAEACEAQLERLQERRP